jgi:hypothetical protein
MVSLVLIHRHENCLTTAFKDEAGLSYEANLCIARVCLLARKRAAIKKLSKIFVQQCELIGCNVFTFVARQQTETEMRSITLVASVQHLRNLGVFRKSEVRME